MMATLTELAKGALGDLGRVFAAPPAAADALLEAIAASRLIHSGRSSSLAAVA